MLTQLQSDARARLKRIAVPQWCAACSSFVCTQCTLTHCKCKGCSKTRMSDALPTQTTQFPLPGCQGRRIQGLMPVLDTTLEGQSEQGAAGGAAGGAPLRLQLHRLDDRRQQALQPAQARLSRAQHAGQDLQHTGLVHIQQCWHGAVACVRCGALGHTLAEAFCCGRAACCPWGRRGFAGAAGPCGGAAARRAGWRRAGAQAHPFCLRSSSVKPVPAGSRLLIRHA